MNKISNNINIQQTGTTNTTAPSKKPQLSQLKTKLPSAKKALTTLAARVKDLKFPSQIAAGLAVGASAAGTAASTIASTIANSQAVNTTLITGMAAINLTSQVLGNIATLGSVGSGVAAGAGATALVSVAKSMVSIGNLTSNLAAATTGKAGAVFHATNNALDAIDNLGSAIVAVGAFAGLAAGSAVGLGAVTTTASLAIKTRNLMVANQMQNTGNKALNEIGKTQAKYAKERMAGIAAGVVLAGVAAGLTGGAALAVIPVVLTVLSGVATASDTVIDAIEGRELDKVKNEAFESITEGLTLNEDQTKALKNNLDTLARKVSRETTDFQKNSIAKETIENILIDAGMDETKASTNAKEIADKIVNSTPPVTET